MNHRSLLSGEVILALALFHLIAVRADAAIVVFDTFGPGDSYSSGGWVVYAPGSFAGDIDRAMPFAPSTSAFLQQIEIPLSRSASGTPAPIDIIIAADNGGEPGAPLETTVLNNVTLGTPGQIYNVPLSGSTFMAAGQTYWVWLSTPGDSSVTWHFNGQNLPAANHPYSIDGGVSWIPNFDGPASLRVTAVPEPGMAALLAVALGAWMVRRRHPEG